MTGDQLTAGSPKARAASELRGSACFMLHEGKLEEFKCLSLATSGRRSSRRDRFPANSLVSRALSSERVWPAARSVSSRRTSRCSTAGGAAAGLPRAAAPFGPPTLLVRDDSHLEVATPVQARPMDA